ncbi:hypothetical protein MUN78_05120 [Leucobacter allii]|uniref:NTF2-like N-terminal transpeptidase domain-containing protein n=1 Tax=Leucobacter allii TaxID=2932247 RepID=A0ABY4FPL3_9MICO|nr:hypothetical protein [Leucobacter allii]UOQ58226.1 hypothetical protein MUN78_05120 [Leucobacter allii]UOR02809.1 hypothetical protein MUN77_05735 [Leucobacter allii]
MNARWGWTLTAVLTVLVLGGAGAAIAVDAGTHNSGAVREVAEDYVAAVAAGDAERADALAVSPLGPGVDPEAVASAEHIADAELRGFRVDFDRGRAGGDVSYALEGERHRERLELLRVDGEWRVAEGLRTSVLADSELTSVLAFRGMAEPFPRAGGEIPVYAGAYTLISFSEFFELRPNAVVSTAGGSPYLSAEEWLVPAEAYAEEVQRQIDDWYEECAERTEPSALRECGIEIDAAATDLAAGSELVAEVEMLEAPRATEFTDAYGWGALADLGRFSVELSGRDDSGARVSASGTARAVDAEIEVGAARDALDVSILPY